MTVQTEKNSRHMHSLHYALNVLLNTSFADYIEEISLYGSCARGEQKYQSDVDLLIRVTEDTPARIMRRMRSEVIPDDIELPDVELKFYSGDEYSSSPRFNKNIERDKKIIWKKI